MKKFKYTSYAAVVLLSASIASCNKLDEYNPSGATSDGVWNTPQGFVTIVNGAYYEQRNWYGKEDGIFMSEAGTDLWYNREGQSYNRQLARYDGLNGTTGTIKNDWAAIWRAINQCNAGIGRIGNAGFTNEVEKNRRLGELHFLRAFYYWHVVETWGNVMLRTKETTDVENTAKRATIKEFYDLIFSDLEFAKDNLPDTWGNEYSRATRKSALGLLARAYLTRAYYPDADANAMFTKARDVAKFTIENRGALGVDLYQSADSIWLPVNNKKNKEALYIISNSSSALTGNYDANANRDHLYYLANYSKNRVALKRALEYGNDNGRLLQPTRYLLDLFSEGDARYEATFQEKWYNNVDTTFKWTSANYTTAYYKKSTTVYTNNLTIAPKELALVLTRGTLTATEKLEAPYLAFDRNDMYTADGKVITTTTNGIAVNGNYPGLKKFMDPNRGTNVDLQPGYNDIFVIRLAEMYLIAGEAEYKLGNGAAAAGYFNDLRKRAIKPGFEAAMAVDASMLNDTWILEERARELCAEHIRWFDLKRVLRGQNWADYIKARNPDVTLVNPFNWVRPISQDEMNALLNAAEFKQNEGY